MTRHTVYILDNLFLNYEREKAELAKADATVVVADPKLPESELIATCHDAAGLLVNRAAITRRVPREFVGAAEDCSL